MSKLQKEIKRILKEAGKIINKAKRKQKRKNELGKYAKSKPKNLLKDIEGDNFEE